MLSIGYFPSGMKFSSHFSKQFEFLWKSSFEHPTISKFPSFSPGRPQLSDCEKSKKNRKIKNIERRVLWAVNLTFDLLRNAFLLLVKIITFILSQGLIISASGFLQKIQPCRLWLIRRFYFGAHKRHSVCSNSNCEFSHIGVFW